MTPGSTRHHPRPRRRRHRRSHHGLGAAPEHACRRLAPAPRARPRTLQGVVHADHQICEEREPVLHQLPGGGEPTSRQAGSSLTTVSIRPWHSISATTFSPVAWSPGMCERGRPRSRPTQGCVSRRESMVGAGARGSAELLRDCIWRSACDNAVDRPCPLKGGDRQGRAASPLATTKCPRRDSRVAALWTRIEARKSAKRSRRRHRGAIPADVHTCRSEPISAQPSRRAQRAARTPILTLRGQGVAGSNPVSPTL